MSDTFIDSITDDEFRAAEFQELVWQGADLQRRWRRLKGEPNPGNIECADCFKDAIEGSLFCSADCRDGLRQKYGLPPFSATTAAASFTPAASLSPTRGSSPHLTTTESFLHTRVEAANQLRQALSLIEEGTVPNTKDKSASYLQNARLFDLAAARLAVLEALALIARLQDFRPITPP